MTDIHDIGEVHIGLMSGTSLDGISAAAVAFAGTNTGVEHELLSFLTIPYSAAQRARLTAATQSGTAAGYCSLDFDLGGWLADAALAVMDQTGLTPADVRAIASHGQTVWHIPRIATWQMGESAVIAERTGVDVISDFRVRDVAAGGEGAPLVPIADALLYASASDWRLMQNVGGIANVTVVPPGGALMGVRAFDTGPGMVLVDQIVRELYPGKSYDTGGAIARSGRVHADVVDALLRDEYFVQAPPKSTGREHFGVAFASRIMSMVGDESRADAVATAVALSAASIAGAVERFVAEPCTQMIVSGGGVRNGFLMDELARMLAPITVASFDDVFYSAEAKEAVAFALLGYLHIRRGAGSLIGATGARGPRVLGKLTPA